MVERLDRILVFDAWMDFFGGAKAISCETPVSDHLSLILWPLSLLFIKNPLENINPKICGYERATVVQLFPIVGSLLEVNLFCLGWVDVVKLSRTGEGNSPKTSSPKSTHVLKE